MYKKYKVVLSNRGECHQQRGQTVTRKCSPLKDRCYLQCTITVRTAKDCLHLSIANVGIILTFYSHTLVGLTSSLKTRACSSQPIRFWTNLKTCSTNRHTEFQIIQTTQRKKTKIIYIDQRSCSPLRRSMPPPGWRECPERLAAACNAAPSIETESCLTGCSELT